MRPWRLAALVAVAGAMAQPTGWTSATPGRAIVLPADHASHPGYRLEWWYYTGNLDAADGRRFGYQLTFFRIGVDPAPANPSAWTVRDLFMTHLALTDVTGRRFQFAERLNRSGPGWAGAAADSYHVWNEDWVVDFQTATSLIGSGARSSNRRSGDQEIRSPFGSLPLELLISWSPADWTRGGVTPDAYLPTPNSQRSRPALHRLHAKSAGFGVDLLLSENRAAILHGDRGFSRKGSEPGNASHYYSLTRMPTRGTVVLDGRSIDVTGLSWMDHEFGSSLLEPSQVGWDWFSIQLEDGRDLMIFQLRRADGSIDSRSSGTLVEPDGRTTAITLDSGFRLEPGRTWTSPVSRARYPTEWAIRLPRSDIDLAVTAAVENQELRSEQSTGVTYWEGAVDVTGTVRGQRAVGRGYLEMTGYAGRGLGEIMK